MPTRNPTQERLAFYLSVLTTLILALAVILAGCGEGTVTDFQDDPGQPIIASTPGQVQGVTFQQGFGAARDFWQVYFTAPTGSTDANTYVGGVDRALAQAINNTQSTLDIAAFEWNNPALTRAVVNAHNRGVQVRMVIDDEHVLEDHLEALEDGEPSPFGDIISSGIPYVDDDRSGLMHNKFMIMDRTTVWLGSMNYTMNGTYRNNNNMLAMRSRRAVEAYQAEFDEMFTANEFGSKRSGVNSAQFTQDGVPVSVYFSPEDEPVPAMLNTLNAATSQVRFMTFSFTRDDVGQTLLALANRGVDVTGIFEVRGSRTDFSELPRLFCAGLPVFEDGNSFTFHHKVFIVDDHTVITGSFNISDSATNNNDENVVIIQDRDVAAQYIAEFDRMMTQARTPPADQIDCP